MSLHRTSSGWSVRWRQGNANKSRTFARADGFKRDDAVRFDQSMKRKRKLGGLDPLASERLFEDVVQEFWASYRNTVSEGTRVRNGRYMDRARDHFSGYRLCDLTAPELETYRLLLESQGKGAPTIRHIFFLLSKFFRHCIRMGYQQANPVQAIDKPSAPRSRLIQPFPPERVEAVRGWFLERGKLEDATLISVLAYAGPRPAEAYEHLTWADIHGLSEGSRVRGTDVSRGTQIGDGLDAPLAESGRIIFRGEKTGKDRSTRLLEPLRDDLRDWRNSSDLDIGPIFGWSTTRFNSWRDDGAWRRMVDDLNLRRPTDQTKRARPYDLRHAFCTLMLGEGMRLPDLAREMGNSLNVCTSHYAHLDDVVVGSAEERIWAARKSTPTKERSATA